MAKSTKRNVIVSSALAIAMSVSVMAGGTYAWFTDTAKTSVCKVQAGTLNVGLEMNIGQNGQDEWVTAEGETLNFKVAGAIVDKDTQILWEPGCTYELPELRVINYGNLALKYKVVLSGINGDAELNKVIDWTIGEAALGEDKFLGVGANAEFTISGHMRETAGNEYQGKSIDGVGITVIATQASYEKDSTDDQYDKDAEYPLNATVNDMQNKLTLEDIPVDETTGKHVPVVVTMGAIEATDIDYREHNTGVTGKGVMLGNKSLNHYAAAPAAVGEYKFVFKNGSIKSAATGYDSIDSLADTSVYLQVPGNSDVVFENMVFEGVVSFDIQKYTSPWSHLNSISFYNCTFNGIIVGCCPASHVTIDGCEFKNYTNSIYANNSNPIWWRADYEGQGSNATYINSFTFVNNTVTSTRPVKIERIGRDACNPVFTFKNNTFDISKQEGDDKTKNMAINIGQWDNNSKFTLIDDGNTISANTSALYTAALGSGSNQYVAVSGNKVLDGNGKNKTIIAMVWKTTSGETFEMKTID